MRDIEVEGGGQELEFKDQELGGQKQRKVRSKGPIKRI